MPTTKAEVLKALQANNVRFLRLQFTDVLGVAKNVEVPFPQCEKALDGQIMFDGSSIEGFTRVEESDMLLHPDLETFRVFPIFSESDAKRGRVARVICDIALPDGKPFEGDPRFALKRMLEKTAKAGFDRANFGPELEFFLFQRSAQDTATTMRLAILTSHHSIRVKRRGAIWSIICLSLGLKSKPPITKSPPGSTK
jgi:glutamine synthetase